MVLNEPWLPAAERQICAETPQFLDLCHRQTIISAPLLSNQTCAPDVESTFRAWCLEQGPLRASVFFAVLLAISLPVIWPKAFSGRPLE